MRLNHETKLKTKQKLCRSLKPNQLASKLELSNKIKILKSSKEALGSKI